MKVCVCGGADMMEEEQTSALGHVLKHKSLCPVILPVLNQSSVPHFAVVLGKCVCPAPEQEDSLSASCLAL